MAQKRSRAVRPFEAMAHIDPNGSFLLALTHRSITRPKNSSGTNSRVTDPVITELWQIPKKWTLLVFPTRRGKTCCQQTCGTLGQ